MVHVRYIYEGVVTQQSDLLLVSRGDVRATLLPVMMEKGQALGADGFVQGRPLHLPVPRALCQQHQNAGD